MWTLPNILTMARAVAGLPVAMLALVDWWWAAFALFVAAAATDWLDGRIARARGQVSEFGRFLDPIADKLMVAAALVVLVAQGIIAGWGVLAAILILVRELLV
ncbi:MAG: CDP-alcohol phosphatidyltransferase family protein, partial [Sphingomonadaceae bacterium]